jgi:hypothetical protein
MCALELPGIPVGPRDSIEVADKPDPRWDNSPQSRMFWWHYADRDVLHPSERFVMRAKGERCCGGRPVKHTIVAGGPDDIEHLTLRASLLCGDCGRHGYITDGRWHDA